MKDSFVLYTKYQEVFDQLSDEDAGKLIKGILEYSKTGECNLTGMLKVIFTPIKQDIDRNNEKYEAVCERNRENGKKGGRPKANGSNENPKNPSGYFGNPEEPKKADNDYDNDILTEQNRTFNLIINNKSDELKVDEMELKEFNRQIERLDFKVEPESVDLIPEENLANFKVVYIGLFKLFFNGYRAYFSKLSREKIICKLEKTAKYLKKRLSDSLNEYIAYFIKCLQDDFEKQT